MEIQQITSRQNSRIKNVVKLREGRQRVKQGRFLIDGTREISRALVSGFVLDEVFVCEKRCTTPAAAENLYTKLAETDTQIFELSNEVFEKIAFGDRAEGIIVTAITPTRKLSDLVLPANPRIGVLEGIEKPGNIGAIMRSADGAGIDALVLVNPRTDLFNPNTIRASLGTVFRKNIATAETEEVFSWLKNLGLPLVTARPEASKKYTEIDYRGGVVIALGSEANGLTPEWDLQQVMSIKIPMLGLADSLNVSNAASILFYETLRQQTASK